MLSSPSSAATGSMLALFVLTLVPGPAWGARRGQAKEEKTSWLPDEMPLPLVVRTPQDLAFKAAVERHYLIFNLLAGGKVAFDAGRFSEAADNWETLLQVPDIDPELDRVVRPMAIDARKRAGQEPTVSAEPPPRPEPEPVVKKKVRSAVDVSGLVKGGGARGPGGAVVSLRRLDGKTPRPSPRGDFVVAQRGKAFVPHVLAVPVGAKVSFRNDDRIFHNVFSNSQKQKFDLGLYKAGLARDQTFDKPGAVQVFCNIHALMNAWVVTVDTPWYAVADGNGRFSIRNVPPGEYELTGWHELASKATKMRVTIGEDMGTLRVTVAGDRQPAAAAPDKYGRKRQVQLGY